MSKDPNPRLGQCGEYLEQQVIEVIARSRWPMRAVKEIQPGFYPDTHHTNYVWIILLEPIGNPLANTHTTVDSIDIQAWH